MCPCISTTLPVGAEARTLVLSSIRASYSRLHVLLGGPPVQADIAGWFTSVSCLSQGVHLVFEDLDLSLIVPLDQVNIHHMVPSTCDQLNMPQKALNRTQLIEQIADSSLPGGSGPHCQVNMSSLLLSSQVDMDKSIA